MSPAGAPQLTTDNYPWRADFPGLGRIIIDRTGVYEIRLEPTADSVWENALRWGWAEPLSYLAQGYCLGPAALVNPEGCAVLVSGGLSLMEPFLLHAADLGWKCLADRLVPLAITDTVRAYPRNSPILMSAPAANEGSFPVEDDCVESDAVMVGLPRATEPAAVHGVLWLDKTLVGQENQPEAIRGRAKVAMSQRIVLKNPTWLEPEQALERDLILSALPMIRFRMGSKDEDASLISQMLAEWTGLA